MNLKRIIMRREGFTLLEVMIALSVLAVGLLATINLIAISVKSGRVGKDTTIANNIAKQLLEDMKNTGYTKALNNMKPRAISSGGATIYTFGNRSSFGTLLPNLSTIQWVNTSNKNYKIAVVVHEQNPMHNLASVRVRVFWQTIETVSQGNATVSASKTHSVSYNTYFSMI